jgi:hypothetical protein
MVEESSWRRSVSSRREVHLLAGRGVREELVQDEQLVVREVADDLALGPARLDPLGPVAERVGEADAGRAQAVLAGLPAERAREVALAGACAALRQDVRRGGRELRGAEWEDGVAAEGPAVVVDVWDVGLGEPQARRLDERGRLPVHHAPACVVDDDADPVVEGELDVRAVAVHHLDGLGEARCAELAALALGLGACHRRSPP